MNPIYQAYLEDVAERKRQGLSPLPYVVSPDGKMTFERFLPGEDLGMVDPNQAYPGSVRLNAPGPLTVPSQAQQTFVDQRPSTDPNDYPSDVSGTTDWMGNMTFDLRRNQRDRELNAYKQNQRKLRAGPLPTKKKRVITEEDGKDTKIVETQTIPKTEDTNVTGTLADPILQRQFEVHAAGTTDLASLPFISDADAAGKGLEKKQDESGMWWWVDSSLNFIGRVITGGLEGQGRAQSETGKAQAEQAEAVAEGISNLFDTTAERDIRMRQRDFAGQRPMQDYQGALAGLIQPPAPQTYQPPPGRGDENLRDPAVLAYLTKQRKEAEVQQAEEDRIWGTWKYDIPSARKQYETDMAEIYKKAMQLSMFDIDPSSFVELATKRMEQTSAFDEQERLQKIQRGIYYTEAGKWDPPSSKRVAFNRAKKFGAGVKLASAISDFDPGKVKKEGVFQTFWKWNDETGWDTEEARSGSDKADELVAKGFSSTAPWKEESGGFKQQTDNNIEAFLIAGDLQSAVNEWFRFNSVAARQLGTTTESLYEQGVDTIWVRLESFGKRKSYSSEEVPPEGTAEHEAWVDEQKKQGIKFYKIGTVIGEFK